MAWILWMLNTAAPLLNLPNTAATIHFTSTRVRSDSYNVLLGNETKTLDWKMCVNVLHEVWESTGLTESSWFLRGVLIFFKKQYNNQKFAKLCGVTTIVLVRSTTEKHGAPIRFTSTNQINLEKKNTTPEACKPPLRLNWGKVRCTSTEWTRPELWEWWEFGGKKTCKKHQEKVPGKRLTRV